MNYSNFRKKITLHSFSESVIVMLRGK